MTDVFYQLAGLSKITSIMIVTVILLRPLLKKTPKKVLKILWVMVGIRSCLPFYIKSRLGIIPSDSASVAIPNHNIMQAEPVKKIITQNTAGAANTLDAVFLAKEIMTYVWLAGVILFMVYMLINYIRIKKSVADAYHYKDNIYISDKILSPFIIGYFNPRIYILSDISPIQLDLIIAHERTHLKNKDHILKALGFILLGVYWFNPFMWIAYFLFCKDIELSCDEEVIKPLSFDLRKEYAVALLNNTQNTSTLAYGVAFCENSVKERIMNIMSYKKPKYWMVAVATILCIAVLVIFFTVSKVSKQPDYVTYEFETYSGKTVKIDEKNIISQEAEEDVAETDKVPENAEIIAPGRDYTYLEDDKYYYVEDAKNNLLTIASKSAKGNFDVSEYIGDGYRFKYKTDCFYLFEDEKTHDITLSYNKDGVEIAGSNVVTFSKVDGKNNMDLIKEKVRAFGGKTSEIKEEEFNGKIKKAYVYSYIGESPDSDLKTRQTYYTFKSNNGAILVDEFRTISPDTKTEMAVDSEFEYVFENFMNK